MKDEDARLTPEEEEKLIGEVLRRTSGSACGRAEELLVERQGWPAFAEAPARSRRSASRGGGSLSPQLGQESAPSAADLALLESHLEHCAACRALAQSLAVARDTLPSLAAFDPGPSFTAAVLDATSRAEPGTIAERLAAWWRAWLARPRFAFEVAYVATLLILLVVGNPMSTLQAASARTVSVAAAGLERAREAWPTAVARVAPAIELPASVKELGGAASAVARGSGLGAAWTRALAEWSVTWDWVRGMASDLAGRVAGTVAAVRNTVASWFSRPGTEPATPRAR